MHASLRTALLCLTALAVFHAPAFAATVTIRVATYNIAADVDGYTTARPGLDTVLEAIGQQRVNGIVQPADIIALEETTSNDATVIPLATTLNAYYGAKLYAASPYQAEVVANNPAFGNGPNAVLYNTQTVVLLESVGVGLPRGSSNGLYRQIVRYLFQPLAGTPANAFYVYVSHTKSSFSGTTEDVQAARAKEAQILRTDSATLPATTGVLYVGDFNLDGSAEQAYHTMTTDGANRGIDPFNYNPQDLAQDWSTEAYVHLATESANALHYRDDFQFIADNVFFGSLEGGLKYIQGSYRVFGNNGTVAYRRSVQSASNTALDNLQGPITPALALAALTTASDHLPVVADYSIELSPDAFPVPTITSRLAASGVTGDAFVYQITASDSPSSFAAAGLPAGLSVDAASGLITGVPTQAGSYSVILGATNSAGTGSATLGLVINAAPEPVPVVTADSVVVEQGAAFSYQITATNHPTSYGADALPAGLSLDPGAGIISGKPTIPGVFRLLISAGNGSGTGSASLNITVTKALPFPPDITSSSTARGQVGSPFLYQIVATNAPTKYEAEGLPAGLGLSINPASGLVSGTPTSVGIFPITLRALNDGGSHSILLTLTVIAPEPELPSISFVPLSRENSKRVTASEGGPKLKIRVVRAGGDLTRPLTVFYKTAGGAVAGQDYRALSGVVTIPAGAATAKIKVRTPDDGVADGTKVLKLKLRPATEGSYTLGSLPKAKILILDADTDE